MREAAPRSAKGSVPTRDNAAESLGQEGVRCAANQNQNKKERKIKNEIICLQMLCHTIAAHFRTDPIHTRELRAYAVDEVKRTNGRVSFESAVRSQRRIEPEDEWPGSY